jgi:hypothetical protein
MPFSGYCNSVSILILSVVHPHGVSDPELIWMPKFPRETWPVPSSIPNCLTSLQNSFSLPPFPRHYLLYDTINIILLLSLSIMLTVLLGIRRGATVPSNWT